LVFCGKPVGESNDTAGRLGRRPPWLDPIPVSPGVQAPIWRSGAMSWSGLRSSRHRVPSPPSSSHSQLPMECS